MNDRSGLVSRLVEDSRTKRMVHRWIRLDDSRAVSAAGGLVTAEPPNSGPTRFARYASLCLADSLATRPSLLPHAEGSSVVVVDHDAEEGSDVASYEVAPAGDGYEVTTTTVDGESATARLVHEHYVPHAFHGDQPGEYLGSPDLSGEEVASRFVAFLDRPRPTSPLTSLCAPGCSCRPCSLGESVPGERATEREVAMLVYGTLAYTGGSVSEDFEVTPRYADGVPYEVDVRYRHEVDWGTLADDDTTTPGPFWTLTSEHVPSLASPEPAALTA